MRFQPNKKYGSDAIIQVNGGKYGTLFYNVDPEEVGQKYRNLITAVWRIKTRK